MPYSGGYLLILYKSAIYLYVGWVKIWKSHLINLHLQSLFLTHLKSNIMPKLKTHSSAKKRFKVTGSGKIKRTRAGKRHILTKKSKCRKLRLSHAGIVRETEEKRVKRLLAMA